MARSCPIGGVTGGEEGRSGREEEKKREKREKKRKEKKKGREKKREREKENFQDLFKFSKPDFIPFLDFSERSFFFVYFKLCFRFLTNTTLN